MSRILVQYDKNFGYTILNLVKVYNNLTVVSDQVGRPAWTRTLAEFMLYSVKNDVHYINFQTTIHVLGMNSRVKS